MLSNGTYLCKHNGLCRMLTPPRSQRLIQAAFLKNDLLKNLDSGQIRAIMGCMYATTISMGCCVIQEGTTGALAYVLEGKTLCSYN